MELGGQADFRMAGERLCWPHGSGRTSMAVALQMHGAHGVCRAQSHQQCSSLLDCNQASHSPAALPTAMAATSAASLSRPRGTAALQQDRLRKGATTHEVLRGSGRALVVVVQPCQQWQALCRHLGASQQAAATAPAKPAINMLLVAVLKGGCDSDVSDAGAPPRAA